MSVNLNSVCIKVCAALLHKHTHSHSQTQRHTHSSWHLDQPIHSKCSCVTANTCYWAFVLRAYCNRLYSIYFSLKTTQTKAVSSNVLAQKVGGRYHLNFECDNTLYRITARIEEPLYQHTVAGKRTQRQKKKKSLKKKPQQGFKLSAFV